MSVVSAGAYSLSGDTNGHCVSRRQGISGVPRSSSARPRHFFFDAEGRSYPAPPRPAPVLSSTSDGSARPRHDYLFDADLRTSLQLSPPPPPPPPPPPAGRGAWRPTSPTTPDPAPAGGGPLTPRVLSSREPLQAWSGRGLSRSEPRPGDGGFRPRYIVPEERLTLGGGGGGRRSLGGPPTAPAPAGAADKLGPEAIAVSI